MTETEFVKEKVVDVYELEVEKSSREEGKVARILLKTNDGVISYKPSRFVDEYKEISGFKVKQRKKELLAIGELPKRIWELNEKLHKGLCRVKINYILWNWQVDNHVMPIRFMKEKQVNEIEFLDIEEKVKR